MGTVTLGEVKFSWQGTYSASATYYKQDLVEYQGDSYVCVLDATNNVLPTVTTNWNLFAQGINNIATTDGDIIYHNGSNLARLPIGADGSILGVNSTTGFPEWEQYRNLTSQSVSLGGLPYCDNHSYRLGHSRMEDGSFRTWGDGGAYRLGDGTTSYDRTYPIIVPFPRGFPGIQAHTKKTFSIAGVNYDVYGIYYQKFTIGHNCSAFAIDNNNDMWVWGHNGYGHLGTENSTDQYIPTNATQNYVNSSIYGVDIKHIAQPIGVEDYESTAVLDTGGKVHTAGYNGYGQLGIGNTTDKNLFVEISPSLLGDVVWLTAGRERYTWYVAVKNDGTAYMWGYNGDYQTATGDTTNRTSPQIYQYFVDNSISIVFARCQRVGVFFIDSNGNLWHTGGSSYGSGGNGTSNTGSSSPSYNQPQKVIDASVSGKVIDIQCSPYDYEHSMALMEDGTIKVTGRNNQGQLGLGNTTDQNSFVTSNSNLPVDIRIKKIFASGTNNYGWSAALSTDGRVFACGYNGYGQLGIGNTNAQSSWVEVLMYKNILDMAPSGYTSENGMTLLVEEEKS